MVNNLITKYVFIIIGISAIIKILLTDFTDATSDSLLYYNLTVQYIKTDMLPTPDIYLHNIGMVVINSFFFRIFDGFIPLIIIHKLLSIIYSTISLFFAYYFFSKIFPEKYALVGTALLAFDWRLIQNVTFGITEPLFLLFVWGALAARKNMVIACMLAGCAVTVRFEGIFMFAILLVFFLSEKTKITIPYLFAFVAPLGFIKTVQYKTVEQTDILTGVVSREISYLSNVYANFALFLTKIANSIVYFGWSTFPNFIFLIPFGILKTEKKYIICLVISALPGIWAYIDAYDTRYFFMSFIFLDILALNGLRLILNKTKIIPNQ